MAVVQAYHDIPNGMLSPAGHIDDMLTLFQEYGVGRQEEGYAMYCWTDGLGPESRGIFENSALMNNVIAVSARNSWPHLAPSRGSE